MPKRSRSVITKSLPNIAIVRYAELLGISVAWSNSRYSGKVTFNRRFTFRVIRKSAGHQPSHSRALSLQVWRFVAVKIWIIPAEHNALESVRLLNDRTRNLPSLNLQKIDEAVDGVGDVAVNQRIVA